MTKAKPKKAPDEDEAQSRRFMEEAEKAMADGGLSPTEAEAAFEGLLTPARLKTTKPE